jgi:hypothetical protein
MKVSEYVPFQFRCMLLPHPLSLGTSSFSLFSSSTGRNLLRNIGIIGVSSALRCSLLPSLPKRSWQTLRAVLLRHRLRSFPIYAGQEKSLWYFARPLVMSQCRTLHQASPFRCTNTRPPSQLYGPQSGVCVIPANHHSMDTQ